MASDINNKMFFKRKKKNNKAGLCLSELYIIKGSASNEKLEETLLLTDAPPPLPPPFSRARRRSHAEVHRPRPNKICTLRRPLPQLGPFKQRRLGERPQGPRGEREGRRSHAQTEGRGRAAAVVGGGQEVSARRARLCSSLLPLYGAMLRP